MLYAFQRTAITFVAATLTMLASAEAQRGGRGGPPPPAKVVLTEITQGKLEPQTKLPGNVFFKEVAELATEVPGMVTSVEFEEGQHVKKGDVLVTLDVSVLEKDLESAQATHQRRKTEFEDAKVRFERAKDLLEDDVTTPQEYDNLRFAMEGVRFQVDEAAAEVDRLEILIDKHRIRAPFDAVILERMTEVGEWKTTGEAIGALALENIYDVIVFVSEIYLPFIGPGQKVPVEVVVQELSLTGEIVTIIQRGSTDTQQYPLKVRIEHDTPLYEGMGVMVSVPREAATECLLVNRDAVLFQNNQNYLVTVEDGSVKRHEVEVVGYDGMEAGVIATNLGPGDQVIVKGHERLRDGDDVIVVEDVLNDELLAGGA